MSGLRFQEGSADEVRLQRPARNTLHNVKKSGFGFGFGFCLSAAGTVASRLSPRCGAQPYYRTAST